MLVTCVLISFHTDPYFDVTLTMGLLTILKKVKEKEKELRLLILYWTAKSTFICGCFLYWTALYLHLILHLFPPPQRCNPLWIFSILHEYGGYPRLIVTYFLSTFWRRGLDNAGKTTILKKFNGEDIDTISPTLGFNIKTLEHRDFQLNFWDVGGQKSLRSYWRNYFESTDGLIWVVDSADRMRLKDCRAELHVLLKEERMAGASLLVFANKQDLPGSLTTAQIQEVLELDKIKSHHWAIQGCSAVTGERLLQGMDWIVDDIASRIYMMNWDAIMRQNFFLAFLPHLEGALCAWWLVNPPKRRNCVYLILARISDTWFSLCAAQTMCW